MKLVPALSARLFCGAVSLLCLALQSGCVTVYQPLQGLQQPTLLVLNHPNFQGRHLGVRCQESLWLPASDTQQLCQKVAQLFTAQGAKVTLLASLQQGIAYNTTQPEQAIDLLVQLQSRLVHQPNHALSYVLSPLTLTLYPIMQEFLFVQTITVHQQNGQVLQTKQLAGRFKRYTGLGIWAVDSLLNWLVHSELAQHTEQTVAQEFSADFYGQLAQTVFHAQMRQAMLSPLPASEALP